MIYVGYQGIGKSTAAHTYLDFIDLESGNFWVDGVRPDDWYKYYANIADHLSKQRYSVFTASHKVFRDYLKEKGIEFTTVYPSLALKDAWIGRLQERYNRTGLDKDYKALKNAEAMYEENIKDMASEKNTLEITDINYNLRQLISNYELDNE